MTGDSMSTSETMTRRVVIIPAILILGALLPLNLQAAFPQQKIWRPSPNSYAHQSAAHPRASIRHMRSPRLPGVRQAGLMNQPSARFINGRYLVPKPINRQGKRINQFRPGAASVSQETFRQVRRPFFARQYGWRPAVRPLIIPQNNRYPVHNNRTAAYATPYAPNRFAYSGYTSPFRAYGMNPYASGKGLYPAFRPHGVYGGYVGMPPLISPQGYARNPYAYPRVKPVRLARHKAPWRLYPPVRKRWSRNRNQMAHRHFRPLNNQRYSFHDGRSDPRFIPPALLRRSSAPPGRLSGFNS